MTEHDVEQQPGAAEEPESRADRARRLVAEGARLLESRRPGEAAAKLEEARQLDPHNVPAAINLGGAYILQGKFKLAVPVLEAASVLEPENVMIWTNLAAAYLGKLPFASTADQDRAIRAYERALALDATVPHVHYNLGLIYLERKDHSQAAAHFRQALETDPNDRDASNYLKKLQRGNV
jgi:tetratricopeptide (TPR) repeat protein